jgi:DNA-directed RNA polymerase subunit RPC12/RpoP
MNHMPVCMYCGEHIENYYDPEDLGLAVCIECGPDYESDQRGND